MHRCKISSYAIESSHSFLVVRGGLNSSFCNRRYNNCHGAMRIRNASIQASAEEWSGTLTSMPSVCGLCSCRYDHHQYRRNSVHRHKHWWRAHDNSRNRPLRKRQLVVIASHGGDKQTSASSCDEPTWSAHWWCSRKQATYARCRAVRRYSRCNHLMPHTICTIPLHRALHVTRSMVGRLRDVRARAPVRGA